MVLDGNKVRYYNAEIDTVDDIFGVTRPKGDEGGSSGVVGNSAWSNWNGKHKVDDFGRWIKGERVRLEWMIRITLTIVSTPPKVNIAITRTRCQKV